MINYSRIIYHPIYTLLIFIIIIFFTPRYSKLNSPNLNEMEIIKPILININNYIELCKNDKLIRGIQITSSKPKITALITIYNSEKYIKNAIRSIQNQNISDIEILIVDDCSNDNSLDIIKQLKIEDIRIKIIRNKKNRGILYSKSLGILKAKGKYIMSLDSDDFFINEGIFYICFKEAIENYIDIIEYSGFVSHFDKFNLKGQLPLIPMYFKYKIHNYYVKQPQLSRFIYQKIEDYKYKLID